MINDISRINQTVSLVLIVSLFLVLVISTTSNLYFSNNGDYRLSGVNYAAYTRISPVFAKSPVNTSPNLPEDKNQSHNIHTIIIKPGSGEKLGAVPLPFEPDQLFIKSGDKVIWANKDNTNHSVVSLAFDSGVIGPAGGRALNSKSTYSFTFSRPGTFIYIDRFHPYMGGVIYVDVPTSQRELISTTGRLFDIKVEMPQNAAYKNNYGPFFIPASVTIPQKARVTWTNKDYVAHTATSGDDGRAFDTKTILPGQSLTLNINLSKGAYPYYCKIHPWMLGNMIVS